MQRSSVCKRLLLQLYTQDFYRDVVEPKLKSDGIFVTQSGPAGVLSSTEVFTAIHSTLHSVFPSVLPYAQHIPSYNDAWVRICSHAVCTACFHIVFISCRGLALLIPVPSGLLSYSLSAWVAVHAATDCFLSAGHEMADEIFKIVKVFSKYKACTQKPEAIVCCFQGFNMAVRNASMQLPDSALMLDQLIQQRIDGSLKVISLKPLSCVAFVLQNGC